jgi:hypothetical protein
MFEMNVERSFKYKRSLGAFTCLAIYCVLFAGLHQYVNRFPVELIEILHIEKKNWNLSRVDMRE